MNATMLAPAYPRVVSEDDFRRLVGELESTPIAAKPDIQVTYQIIGIGIRVLSIGSMSESASEVTELLRSNPEFADGMRVKRIREPRTASCFY